MASVMAKMESRRSNRSTFLVRRLFAVWVASAMRYDDILELNFMG
jgi:hypothetical protein